MMRRAYAVLLVCALAAMPLALGHCNVDTPWQFDTAQLPTLCDPVASPGSAALAACTLYRRCTSTSDSAPMGASLCDNNEILMNLCLEDKALAVCTE